MSTLLSDEKTARIDLLCADVQCDVETIVENVDGRGDLDALACVLRRRGLELIRLARRLEHAIERGDDHA